MSSDNGVTYTATVLDTDRWSLWRKNAHIKTQDEQIATSILSSFISGEKGAERVTIRDRMKNGWNWRWTAVHLQTLLLWEKQQQPLGTQTCHITVGSILLGENHKNEGLLEARANPLPVRGHLLPLTTHTHQGKDMERKNRKLLRERRKKRVTGRH